MLISLNWLKRYVDLEGLSVAEVTNALTDAGLEVEGVSPLCDLDDHVVVGKVLQAEKHPNADTLQVCKVDVGAGEPLKIVCGAPNARVGIFAVVAKVGAVLPGNFTIKKSKIRGEESFGMMCSEQELELSDANEGIIELPGQPKLGALIKDVLELNDTVIELSITPNRADCNGMIGIARDLAAKLGRALTLPNPAPKTSPELSTAATVKVEINDENSCGRFVALAIEGVKTIPSPRWMVSRLQAAGMRSKNFIVDVTNYVMLEYCQPIHAYDQRDLRGGLIQVRRANPGESMTTLDGQNRELVEDDIIICDGQGPVGVAGVMGGANSEVKEDTTAIVVEVAHFSAVGVRKTSKRLGLHTEASHRFERGIDIEALPTVALRVAELLQTGTESYNKETGATIALPRVAADLTDVYPRPFNRRKIALRLSRARALLGLQRLSLDEVSGALASLGLQLLDSNAERMVFEIPSSRLDLEREVDLIEEVGRMVGYDKIPYQLPHMHIKPVPEDPFLDFIENGRSEFASQGFHEAMSFPFQSEAVPKLFRLPEGHPYQARLKLKNPLAEDERFLHTSLVPNLLAALLRNRRKGVAGAKLFESGRVYFDFAQFPIAMATFPLWRSWDRGGRYLKPHVKNNVPRPVERQVMACVLDQPVREKSWNQAEVLGDFYAVKDLVVGWFKTMSVPVPELVLADTNTAPFLNPKSAALLKVGDSFMGYFGELHPECAVELGFSVEKIPLVCEIDVEKAFELKTDKLDIRSSIQKFPPVWRDLALVVDQKVTHKDLSNHLLATPKVQFLNDYHLFDVYQGDNLPKGKKSMAYALSFQSPEKTLTDKEVETEVGSILKHLEQSLGATLR